jgi:hypothetical protein
MGLVIQERVHCQTPNRIHAEEKLFVEHVRERMKGYRWQLPPPPEL